MHQFIDKIKFSILIPSFNRPELLKIAIESVLASNYTNFELIISDDKSPKSSEIQKIADLFSNDIRFKFFSQKNNLGSVGNKNFLINKSIGDYIIFIGDDDIIDPNLLDNLVVNYNKSIKKNNIICFGYRIIDEHGTILDNFSSIRTFEINTINYITVNTLYNCNTIPFWFFHPFTICCPRNIYSKIQYSANVNIGYDFYFLFESINAGFTISVLPFIGFSWRKASKNSSYQNLSNNKTSDILSRIDIFYQFFILKNSNLSNTLNTRFRKLVCNTIFFNNLENDDLLLNYIRTKLGYNYYETFIYYKKRKFRAIFKISYRISQLAECYNLLGLSSIKYIFSRLKKNK